MSKRKFTEFSQSTDIDTQHSYGTYLTTNKSGSVVIMPMQASGKKVYKKKVSSKKKMVKKDTKYRISSLSGPEVKYLDTTPNQSISTGGAVGNLVNMQQGTAQGQRVGTKIEVVSIEYDVAMSVATADLSNTTSYPTNQDSVKFAIVLDKQPNAGSAAWGDVFAATGAGAPYEFRNIAYRDRFEVLAVERVELNSGGDNAVRCHRFINTKIPVIYNNNNGGTISDLQTNNLFYCVADENSSGVRFAQLYGKIRIHYTDE